MCMDEVELNVHFHTSCFVSLLLREKDLSSLYVWVDLRADLGNIEKSVLPLLKLSQPAIAIYFIGFPGPCVSPCHQEIFFVFSKHFLKGML
jgi:hypothetical protein